MANFDTQIEALAGSATQTEMDDWATDGVKEIINILPPELKIECATITSLTSSTPMDLDATGEIFHATRENADSGYHIGCRKVNPILAGSADDSTSIHYVTATDPIYWIESDTSGDPKLFVKPTPTANQPARIHHVAFPTVDVSAVSSIVNFPNEAEYLVVLYTAIKVLQNKMNEKTGDLPSLSLPPAPTAPTMSEKSVSITGTAPTYTKPTFALDAKPSINDLTITAVPPEVPSLSDNSISFTTTAPVYNTQIVAPDFADADNWLNTEEDSELVASRIQIISAQLQEYQVNVQNELNSFNKENTEYQAQLQKSIKDAELSSADDSQKIQKYSSELQSYQNNISKQVQEYQQNLQKETQLWQQNNSSGLQKYAQDMQNELNEFNDANVEYQAKLQKDLQDAQLAESKEGRDLQKYGSELSSYQAEVGAKVQDFQTSLEKHSINYQWYQSQYAELKQDYNQGIQMLVGGNSPQPQQQQQGER